MTKPTVQQIARMFRVSDAQVRAQFAKSMPSLQADLAKAEATDKAVRGTSAEKFRELIAHAQTMSQ